MRGRRRVSAVVEALEGGFQWRSCREATKLRSPQHSIGKEACPRVTGTRFASLPSGSQCNARDPLLTTGESIFFFFFFFS